MNEELTRIAFTASVVSRATFLEIFRQPQYPMAKDVHQIIAETTAWLCENKARTVATGSIADISRAAKQRLLDQGIIKLGK